MTNFEVPEPILNVPYEEPKEYWKITEGEPPVRMAGRRPARYFYKPPNAQTSTAGPQDLGTEIELKLVNRIRERVKQWRLEDWPGATGG